LIDSRRRDELAQYAQLTREQKRREVKSCSYQQLVAGLIYLNILRRREFRGEASIRIREIDVDNVADLRS